MEFNERVVSVNAHANTAAYFNVCTVKYYLGLKSSEIQLWLIFPHTNYCTTLVHAKKLLLYHRKRVCFDNVKCSYN